jgi:hypothetical protein
LAAGVNEAEKNPVATQQIDELRLLHRTENGTRQRLIPLPEIWTRIHWPATRP